MRDDPRRVVAGLVLIEVGQDVAISVEEIGCHSGGITASENREVDHREWSFIHARNEKEAEIASLSLPW